MKPQIGYVEIEALIGDLPATWYPALLAHMIEAAYSRKTKIFAEPDGASRFVRGIEEKIFLNREPNGNQR